jgi:hypothetical protein
MRRVTMMLVAMALMVPLFAVVAYAAAGGNAANAHKCKQGGYLDYTDANGNPFKNEGQCTRYAAKAGQLPDISFDQATGTISGTGFTPNSTVFLHVNGSWTTTEGTGGSSVITSVTTDETGAFVKGGFNFCPTSSDTFFSVTATVVFPDHSTGLSVKESTGFDCG